jgi:peptide/nickel transport system permease protein
MRAALIFSAKWAFLFLAASLLAFSAVRAMPGSPMRQMLFAYQLPPTDENVRALEKAWGLDAHPARQYMAWLSNFIMGDWGRSFITRRDIREEFCRKIPLSLAIGAGGIISSAALAFFLGYLSAVRRGGFCDKLTKFVSIISQSVPNFIAAILVIYCFGVRFKMAKFFTGGSAPGLWAAISLNCLYAVGGLSRVTCAYFREQMNQAYVKFAVSRGFSREYVLMRHAFKPVLNGILSVILSRLAWIAGGSAVLEFAFGIPGISYFLVDSMQAKDYYVLQSYVMVIMVWMFLSHIILGFVMRWLNPAGIR